MKNPRNFKTWKSFIKGSSSKVQYFVVKFDFLVFQLRKAKIFELTTVSAGPETRNGEQNDFSVTAKYKIHAQKVLLTYVSRVCRGFYVLFHAARYREYKL